MSMSDCCFGARLRRHGRTRILACAVDRSVRSHTLERGPNYSITSSASAITVGGTVKPSVVAVLRLMANSNLTGACAGSSAGLAPLKIRSIYDAERRKISDVSGPYDIGPPFLMTC